MEANEETRVPAAIGVSFRRGGKVYSFDPNGVSVQPGDHVLARTERGVDIGEVVAVRYELSADERSKPLKPLVRRATRDDIRREERLREREREATAQCEQKIHEHGLPMKLVEADYTFDGQRLVFFFSSESRVDFRNLVRDLTEMFRCRIELRQIGVRDEAKMVGGLGPCGRPLCCAQWLRNFDPVGIKVAKDQGMPLNPAKISGICDRLMCCLKYEHAVYLELASRLPQVGDEVRCGAKIGRVRERVLLKEHVVVEFRETDTPEFVQVGADSLRRAKGFWQMQVPEAAQPDETAGEEAGEAAVGAASERPGAAAAGRRATSAGRAAASRPTSSREPGSRPAPERPSRDAGSRPAPERSGRRSRTYAAVEDFEREEAAHQVETPEVGPPVTEEAGQAPGAKKRRPRRRGRGKSGAGATVAGATVDGAAPTVPAAADGGGSRVGAPAGPSRPSQGAAPGGGAEGARQRPTSRRRSRPSGVESGTGEGRSGDAGGPPSGSVSPPQEPPEGATASASRRARWRRRRPRGDGQPKGDGSTPGGSGSSGGENG